MKVENIDYGDLHIITFDECEQKLKDNFYKYHIGKNIYDVSEDTINNLLEPRIKDIYIKLGLHQSLYYDNDDNLNRALTSTTINDNKFNYQYMSDYDPADFLTGIVNAEVEPKLPLCYYPRSGKTFIRCYIAEKVPKYFIHKQLFLEIVENPDQSYNLEVLMPMYADLLPYKKINSGLPQLEINNILRETIVALLDLF